MLEVLAVLLNLLSLLSDHDLFHVSQKKISNQIRIVLSRTSLCVLLNLEHISPCVETYVKRETGKETDIFRLLLLT